MIPFGTAALGAIGRTPLLSIPLPDGVEGSLWAKAEMLQPGGSVKDRAALACIQDASASGILAPKQAVVEMTSGNMGAGLAVVCAASGHPLTAYMSAGNSPQRARYMQTLGATVVLVDQVDGRPGQVTGADIAAAGDRARQDAADAGAWYVDQFNNPSTARAHQDGTAAEIWDQTVGGVDAFVSVVGSGGTLIGCARGLKAKKPIHTVAVEPALANVLAGGAVIDPRHILQGSGYGSVPPLWDAGVVDEFVTVSDDEAIRGRRWLAEHCGLDVGFTAAAKVAASVAWLRQRQEELAVVTVLCDTGQKYPPEEL